MRRWLLSFCVTLVLILATSSGVQETHAEISQYKPVPVVTMNTVENIVREMNNQKQIECLADNIYHESKGESHKGQVAVAFVTLNRTEDEDFPEDVCGVVKQKTQKKCQFSWYCTSSKKKESRKPLNVKLSDSNYEEIKRLAEFVYYNKESISDPTKGALYFHAKYVNVKAKGKRKKAIIGRHIFYNIKKG